MHRIVLTLAIVVLLAGCAAHPKAQPISYYEIRHEGVTYVVGNIGSADKVRAGQPPAQTVRRLSSQGLPVFIEANGEGLEHRLMAEYDKRHGLSQ